jgi:hypothetical protein
MAWPVRSALKEGFGVAHLKAPIKDWVPGNGNYSGGRGRCSKLSKLFWGKLGSDQANGLKI